MPNYKISVIGPANAGKSSFIRALFDSNYVHNTAGMRKSNFVKGGDQFEVMEMPGLGAYFLKAVKTAYRDADLVYVVCDLTKVDGLSSINEVYLPAHIHTNLRADSVRRKVVLVGNKAGTAKQKITAETFADFVRDHEFDASIMVNSKSKLNISDAYNLIKSQLTPPDVTLGPLAEPAPVTAKSSSLPVAGGVDVDPRAALLSELTRYRLNRSIDKRDYYFGFFSQLCGGLSKTQKINAAAALMAALTNNKEIDAVHLPALSQGKLAGIYQKAKPFLAAEKAPVVLIHGASV